MKARHRGCFGIIHAISILFFLLASAGFVRAETYGALTYEIHGAVVEITDCDQATFGSLIIPTEIDGRLVTTISDFAFYYCYNLTSITIPDGITTIGNLAFAACRDLTSITVAAGNGNYESLDGVLFNQFLTELIQCPSGKVGVYAVPDSVNAIDDWAFYYCDSLTGILIPSGAISIGVDAFMRCDNLTTITVAEGNWKYESVDGVLFNEAVTELIQCPGGKTGAYTLPGSVTVIDNYAFSYCNSLTSILIPSGVNSIGDYAFRYCEILASITVAAGNGWYESVDGVLFNEAVTTLIQCPGGKIGVYAIPESVTSIDDYAFTWCRNLTGVTLPSNLASIGRSAFYYCDSLTSIIIPAGVTAIGDWVFSYCDSLTNITLPSGLISIGEYAFYSNDSLTGISIPAEVTIIENFAFKYCRSLSMVIFEGNAPMLGDTDVFANTQSGFSVYYYIENSGFTSPTWQGYPAEAINNIGSVILWLDSYGYSITTGMDQDMNGDGVALLTAYALGLDPRLNLSGSLPKPMVDSNTLGMRFYAGAEGVGYILETSVNLWSWSTTGVSLSSLDAENFRTASVNLDSPCRFLRLRFVGE